MTKPEIDMTMAVLTEAKKNGQFRAFWKELQREREPDGLGRDGHSVDVVARRDRGSHKGIPCVFQPLKEATAPGPPASACRRA